MRAKVLDPWLSPHSFFTSHFDSCSHPSPVLYFHSTQSTLAGGLNLFVCWCSRVEAGEASEITSHCGLNWVPSCSHPPSQHPHQFMPSVCLKFRAPVLGSQTPLRNYRKPWSLPQVSTYLLIIPRGSYLPLHRPWTLTQFRSPTAKSSGRGVCKAEQQRGKTSFLGHRGVSGGLRRYQNFDQERWGPALGGPASPAGWSQRQLWSFHSFKSMIWQQQQQSGLTTHQVCVLDKNSLLIFPCCRKRKLRNRVNFPDVTQLVSGIVEMKIQIYLDSKLVPRTSVLYSTWNHLNLSEGHSRSWQPCSVWGQLWAKDISFLGGLAFSTLRWSLFCLLVPSTPILLEGVSLCTSWGVNC